MLMKKKDMKRFLKVAVRPFCLIMLPMLLLPAGAQTLTDPYEIMEKAVAARGGKYKILAVKNLYYEGTVTVSGMSGTFKLWEAPPDKNRSELVLQVIRQHAGDNGKVRWNQDTNGKITVNKDILTEKRREVVRRNNRMESLDKNSKIFTLTYKGIETVKNKKCYVIETSNTITDETEINYIDCTDFLPVKNVKMRADNEIHTTLSQYARVEGLLIPFKVEVHQTVSNQTYVFRYDTVRLDQPLEPGFFDPPRVEVADIVFPHGKKSVTVPFKYIDNHFFIDVKIAGKTSMWCLDSGASMTVIDRQFAEKLGLKLSGSMQGQAAGNRVETSFAFLPEYTVSGIGFKPQQAAVIRLAYLFKSYGLDVEGILGYDFLSRFVTRIDFASGTLELFLPGTFTYQGNGAVIAAPLVENIFTVPVTVDGKKTGMWRVDIGAGASDFHYHYARENGFLTRPGIDRLAAGVGGTFTTRMLRFDSLQIGRHMLKKPVLNIPTRELKGALSRKELTGNLGNDILRHFVLYLNYGDQEIILEKGKDFGRRFALDKCGMQFSLDSGGRVVVVFVSPGTPAHASGLERGDVITAINGEKVKSRSGLTTCLETTRRKPGTQIKIKILRREKEIKEFTLTLKELL